MARPLLAQNTTVEGVIYADSPAIAVDESGNAVVVWEDNDIYAQRLDVTGRRLWAADVCVNSDSGRTYRYDPAVAVDGNGNAVVVWQDDRNGDDDDIYAQRLAPAGNKLWAADVRVNSDNGTTGQFYPAAAVDGSGNIIVVWKDERNGNDDIYAQRLDSAGNKLWVSDLRVNSDSSTTYQSYPAVAVDGNDNAVIVWKSGGIYAQRLDASGNKLWVADVRANADGWVWLDPSTVAVDRSGNAIVVWEDHRNSNADVYDQWLNVDGHRLLTSDVQIVYPDFFYFPAGTVQSRSVDNASGIITETILTADYQTNGGTVQFYLTNDGGAHWAQVTPGATHIFTTTGSDLRWKAMLTADPLWRHRAPVVEHVRIEYQTIPGGGDDYEPDDTCAQARPIAVNGVAQQHTFHQQADADWAHFTAISGTTYIVQAVHAGAGADLELELHGACDQPPLPPQDEDTFGNDARLVFAAPATGVYYVKAMNHNPTIYGEDTGYQLAMRTQSPAPLVTIVAGRNEVNQLVDKIIFMGDQAYRTFRRLGVPRGNIRYLSVGANRDANQDGYLDVDGPPTWENVRYAVQDWPRERGVRLGVPFYLYLVDHGGPDYYCADGCAAGKRVSATDLNLWLDNLEATSGADEINVTVEACYSGSFIDVTMLAVATISSRGRVVIASTGSRARSFASERGGYFSDAFFTALGDNADLWTAYEAGRAAAQAAWGEQTPWLDDNGNAIADERDGAVARERGLVAFGGGSVPAVDWLGVGGISASGTATIIAQVRDDVAVVTVTVEVYPPGLTVPETGEGETPVLPVERVDLQDGDGDGVYEGVYTDFTEEGVYRLVAYAWDNDGNLSLPRQTTAGERKVFLPLVMRND